MARPLGGWWRLWIVVSVIYGGLVAAYTWMLWPEVSRVQHDARFIKQMSPGALAVLEAPKTIAELERALIEADRSGATEQARTLARRIRDLREGREWETAPIVLEMPNGHEFKVAGDTKDEQAKLVGKEYVRLLQSVAAEQRFAAVGTALLAWLIPSLLLCGLGLAVAWVIRGFKRREP